MTRQQAVNMAISIVEEMRDEYVPRDTDNMAFNALEYEILNGILAININPKIAPYVPYTNEPWLSPKWNGKKNPNEGWWDSFVAEFTKRLANKLKGVIK
ncbi:MAG: hypothetical protein K2K80_05610 [Clostridia bacterium]|nr:hypothetical protein [Clostridia bacterium]